MNISYLKNKNIHFVECENWHDAYGYEKSEMKEDTINYIDKLQQENRQLQKELEEYKNPIKYFKYANKNVVEENKKLKDNWNKLKEYIRKNIIYDDVGMKILDPSPLEDYIQELEQGSDNKC